MDTYSIIDISYGLPLLAYCVRQSGCKILYRPQTEPACPSQSTAMAKRSDRLPVGSWLGGNFKNPHLS